MDSNARTSTRSYPPTKPHTIVTFNGERAQTEPVPRISSGFLGSVIRHRDMDDIDEGVTMSSQPEKKRTFSQQEQDAEDDRARKHAMRNLVNSWQERLQLISVITTFFASTEAAMLVNTKPLTESDVANQALQASNACLLGALIVHVYAAVLSFLGAFLLIRYKLKEATLEEMRAEGLKWATSPLGGSMIKDGDEHHQQTLTDMDTSTMHKSVNYDTTTTVPPQPVRNGSYPEPPIVIMSRNPHIEQVGPFKANVPSHLLSRTHGLCVFLAAVGFVLAIVGILCYAWAVHPLAVSIFASATLGVALLALVVLLL